MALEEVKVDGLGQFLELILSRSSADKIQWYRGVQDDTWGLSPSLERKLSPFSAEALLKTERRLITRFRQRSLPLWPEGYPQTDWEQLFAMQHWGVATRLLDWSESPLVAAYFAAEKTDPASTGQPVVWCLDPVLLNRNNKRLDGFGDAITVLATTDSEVEPWAPGTELTRFAPSPIAIYGTHNSGRIVAQQGTFTVAGKQGDGLQLAPAVKDFAGVLTKITFSCAHAALSTDLKTLGIRRGSIFPDLANMAQDISESELG